MCLAFKISFQGFFCKLSIFCEDMNKKCTLKLYHDIHMGDWQKENLFLWNTINMDKVYGWVVTAKNDFESLVFLKIPRSHYSLTFIEFLFQKSFKVVWHLQSHIVLNYLYVTIEESFSRKL